MFESLLKLLSIVILSFTGFTAVAESIDAWLDKMSQAMLEQNYQGTLIIRQSDKLQAIKVKQGVTNSGSWQTLESMTGEDQTIIRRNNTVTTVFPAKKLITFSERLPTESSAVPRPVRSGVLHSGLPENKMLIRKYYALQLAGTDRIADKTTQIIKMRPKDKHRYGYTFWLDKTSGMLLKCDLIDTNGRVLEQLMYSDVQLLDHEPSSNIDSHALKAYKKIQLSNADEVMSQHWQADQLPAGFELARSVKTQDDSYHLVFTDGMASVSVFIEPQKHESHDMDNMEHSSMGPVHAYIAHMDDVHITAIGEVPAATVRMIAQSISPTLHAAR